MNASDIVPEKAIWVLEHVIRTGVKPDGYIGNRRYHNANRQLPAGGDYREFDIDPKPATGPRARGRLIIDRSTARVWYTGDHYETFVELEYGGDSNENTDG